MKELRKETGTEVIMYSKDDLRCRHPNHPRTWYSKNIWCDEHRGYCPRCQKPCCSYFSYTTGLQPDQMSPLEMERAKRIVREMEIWIPTGSDESTFMECTGCHKYFCPECCSVCPHPHCGDRMCHVSLFSDRPLWVLTFQRGAIQTGNGFSATCMMTCWAECVYPWVWLLGYAIGQWSSRTRQHLVPGIRWKPSYGA